MQYLIHILLFLSFGILSLLVSNSTFASSSNNTSSQSGSSSSGYTLSGSWDIDTVTPTIIPIKVVPGMRSIALSWKTSENSNAAIAYSTNPEDLSGIVVSMQQFKKNHVAKFTKLLPDTTYYYKIIAVDMSGNIGSTSILSVKTKK